ncbi:MAG: F0F1 ATP synthase subunit epsilon [Labilithrix sp.]|nr:F0F1 ATP synthase subunit epsilon [Labilithrix sp.]MCW5830929.1 F0F1 ATP synthase subunit epsilon [Labilithrix sp.]
MSRLTLRVRTPARTVLDAPVRAIRAEDLDGWFGVGPGRADLVAVLPAGLLVYRDDAGEGYVAVGGGLLHVRGDECRVMVRDAFASRELDAIGSEIERYVRRRRDRHERERVVIDELAREALRRMIDGVRR